tara:strand:+ start:86 stop:214 length:129 start_codon:yes stop_codon:yes gene_type:complete
MQKINLPNEAAFHALIEASFARQNRHLKRQQNISLKTYSKDS